MTTTADTDLAVRFCRILNQWLVPATVAEINRRNALPEYTTACASHDFCDANQAMLDAMEQLGIVDDVSSDETNALVNRAWSIAKANGFDPEAISCAS